MGHMTLHPYEKGKKHSGKPILIAFIVLLAVAAGAVYWSQTAVPKGYVRNTFTASYNGGPYPGTGDYAATVYVVQDGVNRSYITPFTLTTPANTSAFYSFAQNACISHVQYGATGYIQGYLADKTATVHVIYYALTDYTGQTMDSYYSC